MGLGLDGMEKVLADGCRVDCGLCGASSLAVVAPQYEVSVRPITLRRITIDTEIAFHSSSLADGLAIHDCPERTLVEDMCVVLEVGVCSGDWSHCKRFEQVGSCGLLEEITPGK